MKLRIAKDRHILVAAVRGKKLFKGLYTPQAQSWTDFFELLPVWVLDYGKGCRLQKEVPLGTQCVILDSYELDPLPVQDLNYDVPKACIEEAEKYDGIIEFNIIHEDSLVGVVE